MLGIDATAISQRFNSAFRSLTSGPVGSFISRPPNPLATLFSTASYSGPMVPRSAASRTEVPANIPGPVPAPQCSVLNMARELAPLAENAYNPSPVKGFDLARNVTGAEGFAAAVYRGEVEGRPQVVVSFRGTENATDWVQNVASNFSVPSQYNQALNLLREVQQQYPGQEIILTGHSLAGGMAAYSGILREVPAVVFNAAGTDGPQSAALGPDMTTTAQNIVQVNASCDPLTQNPLSRRLAGQPWNPEATYIVPSEGSVWGLECHSMSNLRRTLESNGELQRP